MDGYVYRVGSYSNVLGRPPRFVRSDRLLELGARFASVYAVTEKDARAIEQNAKTGAGYRGVVWSRRLWIDFDETEPADRAEEFLKREGYNYVAFTTGNRGRHIGVLRDCLPSHVLPLRDKLWVQANLPGADISLYWHLHLIRLPGAIHESTGRPKRLIGSYPGKTLILPPYEPGEENIGSSTPAGKDLSRPSLFTCWEVTSRLNSEPGQSRHKHLVTLAKALRHDGKATLEEAMWVTWEVNRSFSEPKSLDEVQRIVKWAYGLEG